MVQLNVYQFVYGYSTGVCTQRIKFISGIRLRHVPNVHGYVSPCGGGGGGRLGVLPQENVEIWSALGAILGLLRVSS